MEIGERDGDQREAGGQEIELEYRAAGRSPLRQQSMVDVQPILEAMRDTAFQNIRTSHFTDTEEREDLYKMLKAIDAFERELTDRIKGRTKAQSKLKEPTRLTD